MMIVNNEQNPPQGQPTRTFNKERAYDFIYKLNKENGGRLKEKTIANYSTEYVQNSWSTIYRKANATMPEASELDSIYNSFFDVEEVLTEEPQKKKSTESPSTTEVKQSSSVSESSSQPWDKKYGKVDWESIAKAEAPPELVNGVENPAFRDEYQPSKIMLEEAERDFGKDFWKEQPETTEATVAYASPPFDENAALKTQVSTIGMDWFNMSESDAETQFNAQYGRFGYKAEQTAFGKDALLITAPNGEQKEVRLFTPNYKELNGVVGDMEFRDKYHKNELQHWLQTNTVDYQANLQENLKSGVEGLVTQSIEQTFTGNLMLTSEQEELLSKNMTPEMYNLMVGNNGTFRDYRSAFEILDAEIFTLQKQLESLPKAGIRPIDDTRYGRNFKTSGNTGGARASVKSKIKVLEDFREELNAKATILSQQVGNSMLNTGAYRKYNFSDNPQAVERLMKLGVNPIHLPLDQIRINGRAASYSEFYNLVTDYSTLANIRDGELNIEIDDSYDFQAEEMGNLVKQAKSLQERNKAFDKSIAGGNILRKYPALDKVADFFQQAGLSTMEVISNTAYTFKDGLRMLGMSDAEADAVVFFNPTMPHMSGVMHPAVIKGMKEEYLPLYGNSITDVDGFAEFMVKGGDAAAQSLPITALFMANPAAGLTAIGVSTYGSELYRLEEQIAAARESQDLGLVADLEEKLLSEMNLNEARAHALSLTATEVAVTRLFTYNLFKNTAAARNFAGARNAVNAQKLADAYGRNFYKSFSRKYAEVIGVNPRVIINELSEEELIAFSRAAIETHWGIADYSAEELLDMGAETGINSLFQSVGIAKALNQGYSKKVRNEAKSFLTSNMLVGDEATRISKFLNNQKELDAELRSENPNQERIDELKLEMELDAAYLKRYRERKDELLDMMSKEDFKTMLNYMADNEIAQKVIEESDATVDGAKIVRAVQNIEDNRVKMHDIISKYPSELSFAYLPIEKQQSLKEQAVERIINEKFNGESEGVNYEIRVGEPGIIPNSEPAVELDITDEEITEVATELFLNEFKETGESGEQLQVLPGFDMNDIYNYVPKYSAAERKAFDLTNQLDALVDLTTVTELDFDETQQPQGAPIEGSVDLESRQKDQDRVSSLVTRLNTYNTQMGGQMMDAFSVRQQEVIMTFIEDTKKGRRGNFGKIESILDAMDIATEIAAKTPNKIELFGGEGQNNLIGVIASISQRAFSGEFTQGMTLSTTDILMETLFADQRQGKPFYELNNEASRIIDVIKQDVSKLKADHSSQYATDAQADLDADTEGVSKQEILNPNSVINSYEMYILGSLYRTSGKVDATTGLDTEFSRMRGLILQELEIRKSEYETQSNVGERSKSRNADKIAAARIRYEKWQQLVDKLGVADAKSYEDVAKNASTRNRNAVQRMADMQPREEALNRIKDFNRFDPTIFPQYLPSFLKVTGNSYVDMFGLQGEAQAMGSDGKANQLKDVSLPYDLRGDGVRLSPGMYYDQMYGAYQGLQMDIQGRKTYRTLTELMDNPAFQQLFEGNAQLTDGSMNLSDEYKMFESIFKAREMEFDNDIRSAHQSAYDVGEVNFSNSQKAMGSFYGAISASTLARLSQNTGQFQSAVSGAYPVLQSQEAKVFLAKKNAHFYAFMSNMASGNPDKGMMFNWFNNKTGIGADYAANIYAQSRTGLRNAVSAELITDPTLAYPLDYYVKAYNLNEEQAEYIKGSLRGNGAYTLSQFLTGVQNASNISLELFLANGDQAAANATFEAHYLDYRLRNGAEIGEGGIKEFWRKENANPDIEAIHHADHMISRTQRQNTTTSEADIYSMNASRAVKAATRLLIPYSRFSMNIRADVANQLRVLNDPTISEEQKKVSRGILAGKVNEVAAFTFIRSSSSVAIMKGIAGLYQQFGLVEEEDIEKYGGTTGFIGDVILPIEDRSITPESETRSVRTAGTIEEQDVSEAKLQREYGNVSADAKDVMEAIMSYENKFKLSNYEPQITRDFVQETIETLMPMPRGGAVDEMFAIMVNLAAEDLGVPIEANEFLSSDMQGLSTKEGMQIFLMENTGSIGIGFEMANKMSIAAQYKFNKGKVKYNPLSPDKTIDVGVTGLSQEMRDEINMGIDILFYGRMFQYMGVGPMGDLNKVLNRLERSIETNFDATQTKDGMPVGEYKLDYEEPANRKNVLDGE